MARLTKRRKETFLRVLRESGIVRRAVAAASPGARDSHKTFYDARDRDAEFRRQWDAALDAALGDVEQRLLEVGSGRVVVQEKTLRDGTVSRRYANPDSRALQMFLAARCSEYRRQASVEVDARANLSGSLNVGPDLSSLSNEELAQVERLLAKAARG